MIVKQQHRTAQREAILAFLDGNKTHPSVGEIYDAVSKQLTTISLATVYNTLLLLKKQGLIRELPAAGRLGTRFDPDVTPHDHLICSECGTVVDIKLSGNVEVPEERRQGFDINEMSVNIYGLCLLCK
ncbi:MAG: transcriptional repressor [Deltaproteobacteria bacterium]|nr:transcriptional repressor [Deltaproteobacteria bacterium]